MSYKKYYIYKQQVSYDRGRTWEDVEPSVITPSGSSLGEYSTLAECEESITPPMYRWINIPINQDYICEECGDATYIYRWVESGWTCDGCDKRVNNIRQVSHDSGTTWENVRPTETSASTLIESQSMSCGCDSPPEYKKLNPLSNQYLTIVPLDNGNLSIAGRTGYPAGYQYSLDSGNTWNTGIIGNSEPTVIQLTAGEKVMFKGTINSGDEHVKYGCGTFSVDTPFEAEGNVMSLVWGDDFVGKTSFPGWNAFWNLFLNCTNLKNVERLSLPATELSPYCYDSMFAGCSSLVDAPLLPAQKLSKKCYYNMFGSCMMLKRVTCLTTDTLVLDNPGNPTMGGLDCWISGVGKNGLLTIAPTLSSSWWAKSAPDGWTIQNYTD